MLYALLVVMVATFNLALGYFAAVRLGWGPATLSEAFSAITSRSAGKGNDMLPTYADEIDIKRLIDSAEQRLRKIRHCKIEIENPLQKAIFELQKTLDSMLLTLECSELRAMVTRFTPPASGWDGLTANVRSDVLAQYDSLQQAIDSVNASLSPRDQHRFLNPRTQLSGKVLSSRAQWPEWSADGNQVDASIESLQALVHSTFQDFNTLGAAALGLLHDLLGESQPAMEWDPTLHRDATGTNQTILAIDAERRLAAQDGSTSWIARVRIDQTYYWSESLGALFFHLAGDRLVDSLSATLPGHWMVVPLPGGEMLIRGEMPSADEFTAQIDRFRQRLAQTTLRVGQTQVNLTASIVVLPDSVDIPTQFRLEELSKLVEEGEGYGGNRVFIGEAGSIVPVMPLSETFEETSLELA